MTELTKAKENSQLKIDLTKKIESLIESDNAYGSNVELLSFKLTDNSIAGKFRDTWNRRVFAYSIARNRLGYRPAINAKTSDTVEQISKKIDNFSLGYNAVLPAAKLDSARQKKPRCTSISFSCGKICLDINKICWVDSIAQKSKTEKRGVNSYQKEVTEISLLAKNLQDQGQTVWAKYSNNDVESKPSATRKSKTGNSFTSLGVDSLGVEFDEMFKTGYNEIARYRIIEALQGLKEELTGQEVIKYFDKMQSLAKVKVRYLLKEQKKIEAQARVIERKEGYGEAEIFRSNNWSDDLRKLAEDPDKYLNEIGRLFLMVKSPSKMKSIDIGIFDPDKDNPDTGMRVSDMNKKKIDKKDLRRIVDGVEIFKAMVGVDTLDNKTVGLASINPSSGNSRSFYLRSLIYMGQNAPVEVTIHELAHWLEESSPEIHDKTQKFFEKRTTGESWQLLSRLTGNPNYSDTEVAKPDKWLRPYMGKETGSKNSEILSMGMEMMYKAPVNFAKADPEYFAFIYNTLRGK